MKVVDFLNCRIDISRRVFQPRIETEFWVGKIIQNCNSKSKILDIFAATGCIGIAILKNVKNTQVHFVDIDEKAISQIKINLKLNKIPSKKYRVIKSNLFKKIKDKRYDYIFANPPYVAEERLNEVESEVLKYEPKRAILGGKGGLFYIKKFLEEAKNFLKLEGKIFMEFDPLQKTKISEILQENGYKNFKFFKDQYKKWRYLVIEKPKR